MKVGQRIICINDESRGGYPNGLQEGHEYTVLATRTCPHCGEELVDVGSIPYLPVSTCSKCAGLYANEDRWFFQSGRFLPVEERSEVTLEDFLAKIEHPLDKM